MIHAATTAAINTAERPLIAAEGGTDVLMRQAAGHLAEAVATMARAHQITRVVVAAGGGGNGGDGLYAGGFLQGEGFEVTAILTHPEGRCHDPAKRAFLAAGGVFTDAPPVGEYLLIDAIQGLRSGPMNDQLVGLWSQFSERAVATVAVDIPTGVVADTGWYDPARTVMADVTLTFGPLRLAHAVAHACGEILHAEITAPDGQGLSALIPGEMTCFRQVPAGRYVWPAGLSTLGPVPPLPSVEPRPSDHKYSGGVTAVVAGSGRYPGAAVLACGGALRATPSLVRYIGPCGEQVLARFPEVVLGSLASPGRVDCWVYGPGVGEDPGALAGLLQRPEPLVIDADGLTQLAVNPWLVDLLRVRHAPVLLTPHEGEATRLLAALGIKVLLGENRLEAVRALAAELGATVLLKGRISLVASPSGALASVDAGHSWLATPGTGDVLAGLCGAIAAREHAQGRAAFGQVAWCVGVHAQAAWLATWTPAGPGSILAGDVVAQLPTAVAMETATSTVFTPESG